LEETEDENLDAIIVDFHAEATSEKAALGHYLDGRVSAVIGTHTHIQTADEKILPSGTAYISDAGMVGPHDSVISFDKKFAINGWITQIFKGIDLAEGPVEVGAVLIEIDSKTKLAKNIKRLLEVVDIN
jgi:calcineurin-like phosphoesterase